MTIGRISYDMINYKEKLKIMENAIDLLKSTCI